MEKVRFDPGLTERYTGRLRRAINKDGSFNVRRSGTSWRDFHPYLQLINMPWPAFWATLVSGYLAVNTLFALVYYLLGPGQVAGTDNSSDLGRFMTEFFFSAHTLTTVGYGSLYPRGVAANFVALLEAMVGLLAFAVATGLLFGRVSRPSARFAFSERMVVAPFAQGSSLQFRLANRRENAVMELEARMLLMSVVDANGQQRRKYDQLKLERENVLFLPLTWTIVHPIDSESPLFNRTAEDLAKAQAEVLILIKAWDETFSQIVHARYSYTHEEIVWGGRFAPAFTIDESGGMVVEVDRVGELAMAGKG
jgi:inward rectifier potassium channel